MEYYYTPKEYISSSSLTIVDEEAKHLNRVLRKKAGEVICVTDGLGNLYKSKISSVSKQMIECTINEKHFNLNEAKTKVILFPALIKSPDRFEFIIEKSVELGVHEIRPVITQNTVNKSSNKTDRWQSIALAAMKQSQRCFLPHVKEPVSLAEAVAENGTVLKLFADEKNNDSAITIKSIGSIPESVGIFIGPEGGFTDEEIKSARSAGCRILNLGRRKYRSETAAVVALGLLLAE